MNEISLSSWKSWEQRSKLADLRFPGIYAIAISNEDLEGQPFSWTREIVYFGMTVSRGGLESRLNQFDHSLKGKPGHGGAQRFRFKYRHYKELIGRLFVAVQAVKCCPQPPTAEDYRLMGDVVRMEYLYLAEYLERFEQQLPEFNDKKKSKKAKPREFDVE